MGAWKRPHVETGNGNRNEPSAADIMIFHVRAYTGTDCRDISVKFGMWIENRPSIGQNPLPLKYKMADGGNIENNSIAITQPHIARLC